jgi:hypothetical protein
MHQYRRTIQRLTCLLALPLMLVACGGGDEPTEKPATATLTRAPLRAAPEPSADALMDWAQAAYPGIFPGTQPDRTASPYVYRYYPQTQNYLGVAGSSVYVQGPITGNQLRALGTLADYACAVYPASCPATTPASPSPDGTYTAYAANGQRFTLTLDFTQRTYSFTGLTYSSYASSGSFAPGSAGNQVFLTGSGVANATFRASDDLIVGGYDFGGGVQPFVAARRFAASAAEAAGLYNNLGVNHTSAGVGDSAIYSSRIDADGTLRVCNDNIVYTLNQCPATSIVTYTLTMNGANFVATAPGHDNFSFRVAYAGSEKIYLFAGVSPTTGTKYFRIGVLESPGFGSGTAYGASTWGEWGTANFTSTSYASNGFAADGHAISLTGTLSVLTPLGPSGMRAFHATGYGFAIQNTQLAVLVGARGGASAGYMQIGGK